MFYIGIDLESSGPLNMEQANVLVYASNIYFFTHSYEYYIATIVIVNVQEF